MTCVHRDNLPTGVSLKAFTMKNLDNSLLLEKVAESCQILAVRGAQLATAIAILSCRKLGFKWFFRNKLLHLSNSV